MTDVTTRQSTPEEIEVRRAEIEATICKGDTVHSDMPSWHDWRLWQRDPEFEYTTKDYSEFTGYHEIWYCTRCRKFEERTVMLDQGVQNEKC